ALHIAVDSGDGDLVLDLAELDSWDATGLGVIMGVHRRAGRCGRRLVLRDVPPPMHRLLVAPRLHRILAIEGGSVPEGVTLTNAGPGQAVTIPAGCRRGLPALPDQGLGFGIPPPTLRCGRPPDRERRRTYGRPGRARVR